jgi:multiple sugar transport system substrate-binding protein
LTRLACRRVLGALLSALPLGCHSSPADVVQLWAVGREGEVVQDLVPEFERRHPGLQVRVQQIPWSAAHEKLITAYVGGAMPDVFQAGNTWLPELVALDALEPLDERIARSASLARADYFPGILDTNVIDGTTWGVPWYVDTRLLFYRSDLLAAAGSPSPPRTWDDWLLAMTRLKARAGADAFAILLPLQEWQVPVILAFQRGAALLRDGDRRGDFRSPAVRDAFTFYLDLFRRGLAPRAGDTAVTNVYQDFARGYFGFYVSGPWNLGEFARRLPPELAGRWATAPWPAPTSASGPDYPGVSLAGGASLVVARGSVRKDAAFSLVEYLSEPAQQVRLHELTGDLPAGRAAWRAAGLADDRGARAFWLQLQSVRSTPKIPEWERIAALIGRYAEMAIREDMTVDEALAGLDHDVDAVLEKRRWLLGETKAER